MSRGGCLCPPYTLIRFSALFARQAWFEVHELVRAPEKITMADVVVPLEGQLGLLDCLEDLAACELAESCSQRSVWLRLRSAMLEGLEGILLSELAADMHQAEDRSAYSI